MRDADCFALSLNWFPEYSANVLCLPSQLASASLILFYPASTFVAVACFLSTASSPFISIICAVCSQIVSRKPFDVESQERGRALLSPAKANDKLLELSNRLAGSREFVAWTQRFAR